MPLSCISSSFVLGVVEDVIAVRLAPGPAALALSAAANILMLALALGARAAGFPRFPLGEFRRALKRVWWLWSCGAIIALGFALHGGLPHTTIGWTDLLLINAFLVPLGEEFSMRGASQTALNETSLGTRAVLGFRIGTLTAAALFGCAHFVLLIGGVSLFATLSEVISAFALGLVARILYQRSRNIWYGVVLHAIGNLGGA